MMAKKKWLSLIIAMGLAAVWAGASFAADDISSIRIVTPAWSTLTNEDGTGLYFDLMRKVFEPAGVEITYDIVPWKRAKDMVRSGEADALLAAYLTEDDPAFIYPEHPMDLDYTVAVFKKGDIAWDGRKSLEGKAVVWKRGYNYQNYIDVKVEWSEIDSTAQGFLMVEKNRVDAYLDIKPTIDGYIKEHPDETSQFQVETAFTINTYPRFGNNSSSRKLIEIYDKRMADLKASGELAEVFKKWGMALPPWK